MKLKAYGKTYECASAAKGPDHIKLYDVAENCIFVFGGISDFSEYSLADDNGDPATYGTDTTSAQQLRADVDYLSVMTGVALS